MRQQAQVSPMKKKTFVTEIGIMVHHRKRSGEFKKHDHNVDWGRVRSTRKEAIDNESDCEDGPQENDYQPVTSQAYTSANDQLLGGTDYPSLQSQRYGPCFDNTDCVNYTDICINNKCVDDDGGGGGTPSGGGGTPRK